MEFQLQLKKLAFSNPNTVLKLRKLGIEFEHGKHSSHVKYLSCIKFDTLNDLLNFTTEYGEIGIRVEYGKNFLYLNEV